MTPELWRDRRVFLTGHTGFKGAWLTAWLTRLGARVHGFALAPPTQPNVFETLPRNFDSTHGDVRDLDALRDALRASRAEIVIHGAAQSLVRASYDDPIGTYTTNVIGTANVLEAIRGIDSVRVAIIITSDKCYAPRNTHAFDEDDPLGGHDPYASSKACAELVTAAYRDSFNVRAFTVRAGNVIGGGDSARDRLIPDLVRAFRDGTPAQLRYPDATRPWQFVLDALHGYLLLAEAAMTRDDLPHAFNFGPDAHDARSVRWIADAMCARWGEGASWQQSGGSHPHESATLAVDSTRARTLLGWRPMLDVETAIAWTTDFYKGIDTLDAQLARFTELVRA